MAKKKFLVFQGKKYLINANVKGKELTKSLAKIIQMLVSKRFKKRNKKPHKKELKTSSSLLLE